jgi:hypothetical protein
VPVPVPVPVPVDDTTVASAIQFAPFGGVAAGVTATTVVDGSVVVGGVGEDGVEHADRNRTVVSDKNANTCIHPLSWTVQNTPLGAGRDEL